MRGSWWILSPKGIPRCGEFGKLWVKRKRDCLREGNPRPSALPTCNAHTHEGHQVYIFSKRRSLCFAGNLTRRLLHRRHLRTCVLETDAAVGTEHALRPVGPSLTSGGNGAQGRGGRPSSHSQHGRRSDPRFPNFLSGGGSTQHASVTFHISKLWNPQRPTVRFHSEKNPGSAIQGPPSLALLFSSLSFCLFLTIDFRARKAEREGERNHFVVTLTHALIS